jgi:phenylalanyl-tRNA synthetase beta chain
VGLVGEVHPAVLENWGIQMPCAVAEIELEGLLEAE